MKERATVLLVEDDAVLRESLGRYLGLAGFAVTAVPDGFSFTRELALRPFAVAVVDLGLPDRSGEELVEITRRTTDSAVIVITARDTLGTRIDCYQEGADLFLGKPVDGRELAAAIRSLAGRHESRAQARAAGGASDPPRPESPDAPWTLDRRRRVLEPPGGRRVELTAREFQLLEILATAGGETVDRARLQQELYSDQDDSARRALDTLVRRTRQHIAEGAGVPPPILTHYGAGYSFAAPVVLR